MLLARLKDVLENIESSRICLASRILFSAGRGEAIFFLASILRAMILDCFMIGSSNEPWDPG